MNIKLIISDNCDACNRAKAVIEDIKANGYEFDVETIHINAFTDKRILITITPALLIDDKLYSYGDIDEQRLLHKIGKC